MEFAEIHFANNGAVRSTVLPTLLPADEGATYSSLRRWPDFGEALPHRPIITSTYSECRIVHFVLDEELRVSFGSF